MALFKSAVRKLTEPKESKRGVMMYDCPFCESLFWSAEKAAKHIEGCKG
jgi:hypothetical protein